LTLCSLGINQNGISGANQAIFASRPAVKQTGLGQEVIQHRLFQAGAAQTWIVGLKRASRSVEFVNQFFE